MRLIDADKIVAYLHEQLEFAKLNNDRCLKVAFKHAILKLDNAPTIDAVPVVHAMWEIGCDTEVDHYVGETYETFYIKCPICGRKEYDIPEYKAMDGNYEETTKDYPYCHCGTRMDGEENV